MTLPDRSAKAGEPAGAFRTAAVILNYNDAYASIDACRRLLSFGSVSKIIIVDNASTDGSAALIKGELEKDPAFAGKAHLIRTRANGGYGYGNNRGVRYAHEHCGAKYALIANPDSFFDEELVEGLLGIFRDHADAAAAGAVMAAESLAPADSAEPSRDAGDEISYSEYRASGWMERSFLKELAAAGPLSKRIFARFINYSFDYYKGLEEGARLRGAGGRAAAGAAGVYAVHGSLIMVDAERFLGCGGFDEEMFLYMEEHALAARLKRAGFRTYLLRLKYRHSGSGTISGAGFGAPERQRMRQASELIYYRKYLGAGRGALFAARLQQLIVLFETYLLALIR